MNDIIKECKIAFDDVRNFDSHNFGLSPMLSKLSDKITLSLVLRHTQLEADNSSVTQSFRNFIPDILFVVIHVLSDSFSSKRSFSCCLMNSCVL